MATQSAVAERRTEKLDVRVSRAAKAKLQAAALATHRSMSDFVMESALSRAEEDAPVRAMPQMEELLKEPGFFESGPKR
jgi:hypothetical protein